jgi:hypothetical protein
MMDCGTPRRTPQERRVVDGIANRRNSTTESPPAPVIGTFAESGSAEFDEFIARCTGWSRERNE